MAITIAGKEIGPIGFGMGSLTMPHKTLPTEESVSILKSVLDAGANCWNAGLIYGKRDYNSMHLLNAYFTKYPEDADKVCISVKGCFDLMGGKASNDREGVRASIDEALKILDGKAKIDVFEPARVDKDVPIEETVKAIAEYVAAGKIGGVGLSECSAATIRKAAAVHPIAAVEVEVSLFSTDVFTNGVVDTCKELGIPIVAYSPLGKGFLTGRIRKLDDMAPNDFRRMFPRFQPDAFDENLKLVDEVETLAKRKGCTAGQIAIAWVAAQGGPVGVTMVPIPGASSEQQAKESTREVKLSPEELKEIDAVLSKIEVKGGRAPGKFSHWLEG